jgi:hypothetical protein
MAGHHDREPTHEERRAQRAPGIRIQVCGADEFDKLLLIVPENLCGKVAVGRTSGDPATASHADPGSYRTGQCLQGGEIAVVPPPQA